MENEQEILGSVDACLARWQALRTDRPFFVGIGGGSASGKTTLAQQMADLLSPFRVVVIHQDRFFKRNEDKPRYFSKIHREERPDYNHPESFRGEEMVACCQGVGDVEVVILEGILTLHFDELRKLMNLKIFMHTDPDERIVRRIRRNLLKSNLDDIVNYYLESVRYRHREFCEPTRLFSDIIIDGGTDSDEERARIIQRICSRIVALLSRRVISLNQEGKVPF